MGGLFNRGNKGNANTTPMEVGLRVQTSAYGMTLPVVYGRNRIPGNLMWYGDFTAIRNEEEVGGKGGGGQTNVYYTYKTSFIMGLCEGPIDGLGTVWRDKEVLNDVYQRFSVKLGAYSQTAWTYLTSKHPTQALNYRGVAYAAASNVDLGNSSSLPNHSFEVYGILSYDLLDGDSQPGAVLYDFLTNNKYGANFGNTMTAAPFNFNDWDQFNLAAELFISPVFQGTEQASEIIELMGKITNTGFYFSEGILKATPYCDETIVSDYGSFVPNLNPIYALSDDDYISSGDDPIRVTRGSVNDAYNQVQVEFVNRSNQYNVEIAEAKDQGSIDVYGLRPMETIKCHWICRPELARSIAQTVLQRSMYIRNSYEFRVGIKYVLLEPTDLITITDTRLGLVSKPVRITRITEEGDNTFLIEAEDAPAGVNSTALYISETGSGYTDDYNVSPGNTSQVVVFTAPSQLSTSGFEVWAAACGSENWGGCQVWASYDGTTYTQIGVIGSQARMGTLSATLPIGSNPDLTNALSVNLAASQSSLSSVSELDWENYATLSYVDGELISYKTATLTAANQYNLTSLYRGLYGTQIASHATGSPFVRLDNSIIKLPFTPDKVGKTLYLKFPAYNIFGAALQSLGEVDATPFLLDVPISYPDNASSFTANYDYPTITLSWTASVDPAVTQYEIRIGTDWETATYLTRIAATTFATTAISLGTTTFLIKSIDNNGVYSTTAQSASVSISQLPELLAVSVDPGFLSAFFKCAQPTGNDFGGIELHLSVTSGFTPSSLTLVYEGSSNFVTIDKTPSGLPLSSTVTYYVRAAAFSKLGKQNIVYTSEFAVTPLNVDADIADGSITTAKLADLAVTLAKINDGAVATSKIADDAITTDKIAANAVNADNIIANAITADKISSNAVTTDKLAANSVTAGKIVAATITGDRIAANTITGGNIAADTVTATNIDSRNLSIKDSSGAIIFSASQNLNNTRIDGLGAFATANQITAANISTYIQAAAIGNAYIGDVIQSASYSAGSAGWKIDKQGNIELNAAVFRGTLSINSAASGARLVITNSVIKVFDAAGTLRVKIGDLTA
jgi:hypothetical protein